MRLATLGVLVSCVLLTPSLALAQASITGVVRDPSMAVLPGVTVEASSPALIEKVRTVVTDGNGIYRVVDLPPGAYTLTFTLAGFATVKRDGVELLGSQTATINADLRVGDVAETVTVTGETPIIDIQSVQQARVIDRALLDAVPAGRTAYNLIALIPGMVTTTTGTVKADVGGTMQAGGSASAAIHGSKPNDQLIQVDGMDIASHTATTGFIVNVGNAQELDVNTSGVSAESFLGGPQVNMIPRDGGNKFTGAAFVAGTGSGLQGTNYTDELAARGLPATSNYKSQKGLYNFDLGIGGPLRRDYLWFYAGGEYHKNETYVLQYGNKNVGDQNAWLYVPNVDAGNSIGNASASGVNVRLTWQVAAKHKITTYLDTQQRCVCQEIAPGTSPEAAPDSKYHPDRIWMTSWSAPLTNRLLLEAAVQAHTQVWGDYPGSEVQNSVAFTQVNDTGLGIIYRGGGPYIEGHNGVVRTRFSATEVTGAHAFKVGVNHDRTKFPITQYVNSTNLTYTFNNTAPQSLTEWAYPTASDSRMAETGIYAQDRWTFKRLTVTAGLRFDWIKMYYPAQSLGPAPLAPSRNVSIPDTNLVDWKDVTPRLGAAYDLFGDGKTAVKATLNKYLGREGLSFNAFNNYGATGNPLNRLVFSTTRAWTDANKDFVPNCDLVNLNLNNECGPVDNGLFGQSTPSTSYDPNLVTGWGKRDYAWMFSASVQREIMARWSVDAGYFRRSFGNFVAIDNRAVTAADFDKFSITAPLDPKLPNGGGYPVTNLYNVTPAKFSSVDNVYTLADNFGGRTERWHGVDAGTTLRPTNGLQLQGGMSVGSTLTDSCALLAQLPEVAPTNQIGSTGTYYAGTYCHTETNWLLQVKGLGRYTIPKITVDVSTGFQSYPGPVLVANFNASNALIQPSLGRPLSGGLARVSVNLVAPGQYYGDRVNQIDFRVGKALRFSGARVNLNVDMYNATNSSAVVTENAAYGVLWRQPRTVLGARLIKFSAQLEF